MMPQEIYLDNNATTRALPEVIEAVVEVLDAGFGNASSAHGAGDRARTYLRRAREATAATVGAQPEQVIFTSGGTEANNLVLLSILEGALKPKRLVTTAVEHSSILKAAKSLESRGVEVVYLPVDCRGLINLEELAEIVDGGDDLVSIQWVNNETGVMQPMREISRLCQEAGVPLHTDAAQAVGKVAVDVREAPVDFLSLTGHKIHAPPGVGALYCREPQKLTPRTHGGPQEGGIRPGTENLPGIVGLGAALELRRRRFEEVTARMTTLRDTFERGVMEKLPNAEVNGGAAPRVPNSTNFQFRGLDGQALVARLDQAGIRCSQSSACTNQRPEPSYVLRAMGLSEDAAYASVRYSVSEQTTEDEIERAVEVVVAIHEQLWSVLGCGSISSTPRRTDALQRA